MFGNLGMAFGAASNILGNRANRRQERGDRRAGEMYNPSAAANPYLNAIPGEARPYYDPFINSGREALRNTPGMLAGAAGLYDDSSVINGKTLPLQYEKMAHNPTAFMDALMQGYNPSVGYKFKQKQMEDAMRNAASAGGFAGTPFHQQQQAEAVQGLLGSDMQQYLENALGITQAGLQGKENRILGHERALERILNHQENNLNRGFQASLGLGDLLANVKGSQASNAYTGAANDYARALRGNAMRAENTRNNIAGWSNLGNHAINMFGGMMGGGMPGGIGRRY